MNAQYGRILLCPPRSHTCNLRFLYVKVSTLKPIVGFVETTSPICSLYKIVVFPPRVTMVCLAMHCLRYNLTVVANHSLASSPSINIRTSFCPANMLDSRVNSDENETPILLKSI